MNTDKRALTQRYAIHSFIQRLSQQKRKKESEGRPYTQNDSAPFSFHISVSLLRVCTVVSRYRGQRALLNCTTIVFIIRLYITELKFEHLIFSS